MDSFPSGWVKTLCIHLGSQMGKKRFQLTLRKLTEMGQNKTNLSGALKRVHYFA